LIFLGFSTMEICIFLDDVDSKGCITGRDHSARAGCFQPRSLNEYLTNQPTNPMWGFTGEDTAVPVPPTTPVPVHLLLEISLRSTAHVVLGWGVDSGD